MSVFFLTPNKIELCGRELSLASSYIVTPLATVELHFSADLCVKQTLPNRSDRVMTLFVYVNAKLFAV